MDGFNLVVFGITSNLSQLKIIPALYDLESQNLLHEQVKVIGIGRKDINMADYVKGTLNTPNRHHQHAINKGVAQKLAERFEYFREDIKHEDDTVYKRLAAYEGNTLFYLATYPELYKSIFENLKKYNLNAKRNGFSKILVEKPIGHNFESSKALNMLLAEYFSQEDIYRVDHYLGKADLENVFKKEFNPSLVDHIQISILENFGIGKRGVYYEATGSLIDMGQNHFMQTICAVAKKDMTVNSREEVIKNLIPDPQNLVLGQYEGYKNEENVHPKSNTDTFFALKTELGSGDWKGIPIYMRTGKNMEKSEIKISLIYKNGDVESFVIISTGADKKYDPYEKLIIEAVKGNRFYFNSELEVEYSWKFIDKLLTVKTAVHDYKVGTNGPKEAEDLIKKDNRSWI